MSVRAALSIVVPAYREERYLGRTLDALHDHLVARGELESTEVVVVTADGPDRTAQIARDKLLSFPRALQVEPGPKVGKGRDVRAGMLAATGELVLFMDADMATPLAHIERFVARLRGDAASAADVVVGSRDLRSIHADWMRSTSSQLANKLVQTLLLPGVRDSQCGFKGFRGSVVRSLFEPMITTGWGFDFEVLGRARLAGLQIDELDIPDWADPKGHEGLVGESPLGASLRTLRELLTVWSRLDGPIARAQRGRRARITREVVPSPVAVRRA